MKISPEARTAIRRALSNAPQWREYSRAHNLSLATMGKDEFISACAAMSLDARKIADDANAAASGKSQEAARVFESHPAGISRMAPASAGRDYDDDARRIINEAMAQEAARNPSTQEVYERNKRDHQETATRMAETRPEPVSAAPKASNGHDTSDAAQLMALIAKMAGASVNPEQVREIVKAEIAAAIVEATPTVRIELKREGEAARVVEGRHHPEFAALLKACTARDVSGFVVNCWLAGPAGSGKTFAAKTVAKALEIAFHYNGAIGMAHELLGFIDANGSYHRTPFREAYEHGGVYLFDEVDGSDNAALLALNAALANNVATFPDGQVTRHKDCIIIAAANTWGFGGTADYVGRSKIDAAFLSRFPARFDWQYDEALERDICGNAEFAGKVQEARARAKAAGLKVLITPRDSIAGAALIAAGFTTREACERTYLANLTAEQKRMVH